jgi:TRAP-type C4-dicarboxylate transport system permease small subunit
MTRSESPPQAELPAPSGSTGLRIAATVLRAIFICTLVVVTLRVSMPQSETIWSAYETPGDLIRMALGLAVCIWLVIHLFSGPRDTSGYRTWLYLGLFAVPFALICLFAVW